MATRRAPRQGSLSFAAPGLLSGYEVTIANLADVQALPEHLRDRLRPHFDGKAGEGMVFLRDVGEVRQVLGHLNRERRAS